MRQIEAVQDILERLQELGSACMRGINALCDENPSFADLLDSSTKFIEEHAQKIFIATCFWTLFWGPLTWISGLALGIFTAPYRQRQVIQIPHYFSNPGRLGYCCSAILLAFFLLKPIPYVLISSYFIGNHLYHIRFHLLNSITNRSEYSDVS